MWKREKEKTRVTKTLKLDGWDWKCGEVSVAMGDGILEVNCKSENPIGSVDSDWQSVKKEKWW